MRISGTVTREGKHWAVELPLLDAMTQGTTRKNAYAMASDLVETLVDQPGFKATSSHRGMYTPDRSHSAFCRQNRSTPKQ